MSKALITEQYLTDIADSIRAQLGVATEYKPSEMSAAIDSISGGGGGITVEPLSVTTNGTYTASTGKAYSPVSVSVSGGGAIADWDFMSSLTDSIAGLTASLSNAASQDASGISITGTTGALGLPEIIRASARSYEIDIGAMTLDTLSRHHRFFMNSYNNGLIYRSNGYWGFYNGSWATDSTINSYDYFANSCMKVIVDLNGYWHIYKNDTLVYEPTLPLSIVKAGDLCIGSTDGNSCTGVTIESFIVS